MNRAEADRVDPASHSFGRWIRAWRYRLGRVHATSLRTAGADSHVSPVPHRLILGHPSVLVADDDMQTRVETYELLDHWGIQPMLAADGAEAVALAYGNRFNLILMDLQMPVLDGLAATIEIRRLELEANYAKAAIVAHTSGSPGGTLLRDCGFDAVLEKPCAPDELRECLLRWC